MNSEYLNVNEIVDYTTLSHKQVRNNLNILLRTNKFDNLIIGGGKGRGGRFWFHFSLLPMVLQRQRKRVKSNCKLTTKNRSLSEYYYSKSNWDYFGCIHPNKDIDYLDLINSLKNINSFYVIHRRNEINHIHFTIQSKLSINEIKDHLKLFFQKRNISIDKVFLTGFNSLFKDDTINYLLRKGIHSSKKDLIDWGLTSIQY